MLSKAVITAWGLCTLAVQADPSEAVLLAGLPDYSQTGYGYGQEPPQVAVIAWARDFGAIPDDGNGASADLLLVGVTQQASPRYKVLAVPAGELKVPNPRLAQKQNK